MFFKTSVLSILMKILYFFFCMVIFPYFKYNLHHIWMHHQFYVKMNHKSSIRAIKYYFAHMRGFWISLRKYLWHHDDLFKLNEIFGIIDVQLTYSLLFETFQPALTSGFWKNSVFLFATVGKRFSIFLIFKIFLKIIFHLIKKIFENLFI